jgi:hypothetical protein
MKINNTQLGFYLAGLIKGDGCIWTSKSLKCSNGRIYSPQIVFTFHKREKPFYTHLNYVLNTGGITKEKRDNTCVYRITEIYKVIEIIKLINGKFRTPKIEIL